MISGHGKNLSPKRSLSIAELPGDWSIFQNRMSFWSTKTTLKVLVFFQITIEKKIFPIFHPLGHGEILLDETSWVGGRSTIPTIKVEPLFSFFFWLGFVPWVFRPRISRWFVPFCRRWKGHQRSQLMCQVPHIFCPPSQLSTWHLVWYAEVLLMEEILQQLISSLHHYFQGFIHPRWCRMSSINSSCAGFRWYLGAPKDIRWWMMMMMMTMVL